MNPLRKFSTAISLACLLLFSLVTHASDLRVVSYNINGLPWPLKSDKRILFMEIARLISEEKTKGIAPDVLLIQEGFRSETEDMVRAMAYPYVYRDDRSNSFPVLGSRAVIGSGLW